MTSVATHVSDRGAHAMRFPVVCCSATLSVLMITAPLASAQIVPPPVPLAGPTITQTPSASAPLPSFSQLFTGAISDIGRLPSRQNITWLGIGAAAALLAHT